MTSSHKLWAVFWIAAAATIVGANMAHHPDCIAWCTNIANAGGNR